VVSRQNADIADNLQLRDVAETTIYWLSMGCNSNDMLFDSRGGFSRSSYPMKT